MISIDKLSIISLILVFLYSFSYFNDLESTKRLALVIFFAFHASSEGVWVCAAIWRFDDNQRQSEWL